MQVYLYGQGVIAKLMALVMLRLNPDLKLYWQIDGFHQRAQAPIYPSRILALSPFSMTFLYAYLGEHALPGQAVQKMHLYMESSTHTIDQAHASKAALAYIVDTAAIHLALDAALEPYTHRIQRFQSENEAELDTTTHPILEIRTQILTDAILRLHHLSSDSHNYKQTAYTAHVVCTQSQAHAHQWFDDGEIIALLPIKPGHYALVLSSEHVYADAASLMQRLKQLKRIEQFGDIFSVHETGSFPLKAHYLPKVYNLRAPNLALLCMGDAAHTVHPLAGQGLNMGIRNIATYARVYEKQYPHLNQAGALANSLQSYQWAQCARTYSRYTAIHSIYTSQQHAWLRKLSHIAAFGLHAPWVQRWAASWVD